MPNNKKITKRITSTTRQRGHKDISEETLVGEKTQQNFLDIEFNQVHCKIPIIILVRPQQGWLLIASMADFPWKTQKYNLITILWVLLTRLTTEVLPQDFTWRNTSMTSLIRGRTSSEGVIIIIIIIIIQNRIYSVVTFL